MTNIDLWESEGGRLRVVSIFSLPSRRVLLTRKSKDNPKLPKHKSDIKCSKYDIDKSINEINKRYKKNLHKFSGIPKAYGGLNII